MEVTSFVFDEKKFKSVKRSDVNKLLDQILKCRTVGDYRALAKKFLKKSEKEQTRELRLLADGDAVFYDILIKNGCGVNGNREVINSLLKARAVSGGRTNADGRNLLRLRRM